jgi:hypothetical protein
MISVVGYCLALWWGHLELMAFHGILVTEFQCRAESLKYIWENAVGILGSSSEASKVSVACKVMCQDYFDVCFAYPHVYLSSECIHVATENDP